MKYAALVLLSVTLLSACTAVYTTKDSGGVSESNATLKASKAVLITTPKDGHYNDKLYTGSGVMLAERTDVSFARYATHVSVIASEYHSLKDLKSALADDNYGYVVIPTIVHWEHRATAWSGLPSRASIKLTVIDAKTGKEITSTLVEGKSASFTLLATSPEDLLPNLIDRYVDGLYGHAAKTSVQQ